jgi:hypothetical protein
MSEFQSYVIGRNANSQDLIFDSWQLIYTQRYEYGHEDVGCFVCKNRRNPFQENYGIPHPE